MSMDADNRQPTDHLVIKPDGLYAVSITATRHPDLTEALDAAADELPLKEWREHNRRYPYSREEHHTRVTDPFPVLRYTCEVAPGTTIGDLLWMVRADPRLSGFIAPYAHCARIDDHFAELDHPIPDEEPLTWGEIFWYSGLLDPEDDRHGFDLKSGFHGIGPSREDPPTPATIHYGVSGTHLSHLAPLLLQLNPEIDLTAVDAHGKATVLLKLRRDFTLLDILEAIFWEISWWGPPPTKYHALDDCLPDPSEL